MYLVKSVLALSIVIIAQGAFAAANRESGGFRVPVAIYFQYSSIGAGINYKSFDQVSALLSKSFQDEALVEEAKVIRNPVSFEGDVTICAQFKEFDAQVEFVREVVEGISAEPRKPVTTLYGPNCDDESAATEFDLSKILE